MLNDTGDHAVCPSPDGRCLYCRTSLATTADHLRPAGVAILRRRARHPLSVLVPCCASCNSSKGKSEVGLWMVNKFGLSAQTLATLCELHRAEVVDGVDGDDVFDAAEWNKEASEESEPAAEHVAESIDLPLAVKQMRELCYGFCEELHNLVVSLRARSSSSSAVVRGRDRSSSVPQRSTTSTLSPTPSSPYMMTSASPAMDAPPVAAAIALASAAASSAPPAPPEPCASPECDALRTVSEM